ncbi:MAG TPA: hypothetical protein VHS99_19645 [Chloroflexota bacterium]|nr:hypothetical protein [Chloroflexota bacterium]
MNGAEVLRRPRRGVAIAIGLLASLAALALALAGTATVAPEVAWPRFWATSFFILLLWPVGLALLGRIVGLRLQVTVAALLLLATAVQQCSPATVTVPSRDWWWATLSEPGDAIRHRILLPVATDASWQRAWQRAASAAVAICTAEAVDPAAGISVALGDEPARLLTSLPPRTKPREFYWYHYPVDLTTVGRATDAEGRLHVVVRRQSAQGEPARFCGGREDPGRAGAGGSARWGQGLWQPGDLADQPLPLVGGRPAPSRYFIELRLFDARDLPTVGIWY